FPPSALSQNHDARAKNSSRSSHNVRLPEVVWPKTNTVQTNGRSPTRPLPYIPPEHGQSGQAMRLKPDEKSNLRVGGGGGARPIMGRWIGFFHSRRKKRAIPRDTTPRVCSSSRGCQTTKPPRSNTIETRSWSIPAYVPIPTHGFSRRRALAAAAAAATQGRGTCLYRPRPGRIEHK
ncbi:unnamed protein product, partial [Ectocarpus sp. 8 AP-2014]